jgi:integrase
LRLQCARVKYVRCTRATFKVRSPDCTKPKKVSAKCSPFPASAGNLGTGSTRIRDHNSYARRDVRVARERAGIEGLTFHDTRHEAITRLAAKLNVLDLARMVGHRDIKQLQVYYNAPAEEIAMRLLNLGVRPMR